jgi:hypothetical protein
VLTTRRLIGFEHVDNLGAYGIPSETGLLIPSGYNIYKPGSKFAVAKSTLASGEWEYRQVGSCR